nr:hypothetical protein [Tanacetum cinerariifolium]
MNTSVLLLHLIEREEIESLKTRSKDAENPNSHLIGGPGGPKYIRGPPVDSAPFCVFLWERLYLIVDHTIVDEVKEHVGKKKKRVIFVELPAKRLRTDAATSSEAVPSTGGSAPPATEEFFSSSITLTPEPNAPEDSGSSQDRGVRTRRAFMGVVLSSSSRDDDEVAPTRVEDAVAASASRAGVLGDNAEVSTSMPDVVSPIDDFYDSQTVKTATADNIYVPDWVLLTVLGLITLLFAQRDAKIAALMARLEKVEREAAEVVSLCGRVSEMKAGVAVKSQEVETLGKQNAELLSKVSILESKRGELNKHVIKLGGTCERLRKEVVDEAKLREEFMSFQVAEAHRFEQKSVELDARIVDVRRDIDNDLYPHMFIMMAGRRWILSHGIRLAVMKCAQSAKYQSALGTVITLAVEAYDPRVMDDFVYAITYFENVSFGLLDEVESLKDSPLASIMSAMVLKDTQDSGSVSGEVLLSEVVPTACAAAKRRGLCPRLVSGISSSAHPYGSLLGAVDHPISTFVLPNDRGPVTQPPVMQAHDDLFDTSVLDGTGDA